ncbi:MBL fold metallo-hydrolase [Deinococcus roseus]|nr:MBL fold metallo-hydrolase [Deinococcus roseus]
MWLKQHKIGGVQVTSLTDGHFRLDGGAMFGTVPKVLWNKLTPADDLNRIALRINPLLIQLQGKNILIETGMFEGDAKFQGMFDLQRDSTVFEGLKAVGLDRTDIDLVVNTHLHFDHAGRNVLEGKPAFPNARYLVQKQELQDAHHRHERNRASYYTEQYVEPIEAAGLFDVLDGAAEILPGLSVVQIPGHNLGQQAVVLESEGEMLVYTADLLPTFIHAPYPYIMGYDLYPVTTLETRKKFFPEWFERGAVLAPPHDPEHAFGKLTENPKGGFLAKTLE